MTEHDLDQTYSALCRALSDVGPDRAALFLAMLSLSLVSHSNDPDKAQALIAQARARCLEPGTDAGDAS